MDAELVRMLIPVASALLGAAVGGLIGGGMAWLGNRSNALLQIRGQRQLAMIQAENQRQLNADTRRYERRQQQMVPLLDFIRQRMKAYYSLIAAVEGDESTEALEASSKALADALRRDYDATQFLMIGALKDSYIAFLDIEKIASKQMADIGNSISNQEPMSAEVNARVGRELRQAMAPVISAALKIEQAIEAYLDELPGTSLAKRP